MSASEKLKGLAEAGGRRWDVNPLPGQSFHELLNEGEDARALLAAALPQIVAVVEAAENQWRGNKEDEQALDAALSALEEALT
jgi:hypothetical protein